MKSYATLLVIREMQNAIISYLYISIRMNEVKMSDHAKY